MQFANSAIEGETGGAGADEIANATLEFADGNEPNATQCANDGLQATGAIAIIGSQGGASTKPLPTRNFDANYCTRYVATTTYAVQYAAMPDGGCSKVVASSWAEIPNDYVMLLVSAARAQPVVKQTRFGFTEPIEEPADTARLRDLGESRRLCEAMKVKLVLCGVR